jgi:hypothetical protein
VLTPLAWGLTDALLVALGVAVVVGVVRFLRTPRAVLDTFDPVRAGLAVASARYVNAPGLLAWFVSVRLLGQTPREGALLHLWDRGVGRRLMEPAAAMATSRSPWSSRHRSVSRAS